MIINKTAFTRVFQRKENVAIVGLTVNTGSTGLGAGLILLSFAFVLYACPGFVIVLVFLVPHIKLVYLAFFILLRDLISHVYHYC